MKHICIVADGYPTKDNPMLPFVDKLVCEIADLGYKCSVVAPQSITKVILRGVKKRPFHWTKETKKGNIINIFQPSYISFSNSKIFSAISNMLIKNAVKEGVKKANKNQKIDIMYAHFWHCGVFAGIEALRYKLPLFVACGESRISVKDRFSGKEIKKALKNLKGVISVSTENKEDSIKLNLAEEEQFVVLPNGIDSDIFYPRERKKIRTELGITENDFAVAFVGSFIERKGPLRLCDAIKKSGEDIKSVFIGSGEQVPSCDGMFFCGKLPHDKIPESLSACDVFILPTLSEGCCNAIVEAMACGLPVISSNLPFNDDILDESCSLRVNPESIEEIAEAIEKIKNDESLRKKLSAGALKRAKDLTIDERAKKVTEFIEKNMKEG